VTLADSSQSFLATAQASLPAGDQRVAPVPLRQLNGRAGCVGPGDGCVHVRGAPDAFVAWAVAPGHSSLYAVSDNGSLVILRRDARSGAVSQLRRRAGCVNASGTFGCARRAGGRSAGPMRAIAASPDGRNVYALAGRAGASAILSFTRDRRSGALRQPNRGRGCISTRPATGCTTVPGLRGTDPVALDVDPDGKTVVAAGPNEIAVYARAPRDGSLSVLATGSCFSFRTAPGCEALTSGSRGAFDIYTTFAPDGRSVSFTYPGYNGDFSEELGSLQTLAREPSTGALTPLAGAAGCLQHGDLPFDTPPEPDSSCTELPEIELQLRPPLFVNDDTALIATSWAAGFASISAFKREPGSGLLPMRSTGYCWGLSTARGAPPCGRVRGLGWWMAGPILAPNRRSVYLASNRRDSSPGRVFAFPLEAASGALGQPAIASWNPGPWEEHPRALAVSRDGQQLFMLTEEPALHSFALASDGQLSSRGHACLGIARGCRKPRGLLAIELNKRELIVETHDQRFVYALGGSATAFRRER
jgi:hypothetical protein